MVTESTKVEVTDAAVTISDADGIAITAAELSAIGDTTTATVTNAVVITGDHDQVTAALVTAGTRSKFLTPPSRSTMQMQLQLLLN